MPQSSSTEKFFTHGTYGDSKNFIQLRDDLRSSAAFLSLSCTAQCILIDFISHYNTATNFDRDESKINKPILYTFGMCSQLISKNTFYRAMQDLQLHGFITDASDVDAKRGQANRWRSSIRWRGWKPDAAQLRLLNGYRERRSASAQDANQMKFPFVTYLSKAAQGALEERDGITPIGLVARTIVEEIWTQSDSRRQAQQRQKSQG